MSRSSQHVQVGKRRLDLSNLQKVLYPEDGIIKAEVVAYYLQVAPTILAHLKGRPLSLVRYPEGITGESFFQKNKPDWAPEWIQSIRLGEDGKDYPLATEEASLVWLANLACIELHQMHVRSPKYETPDYMVIDLDPPDGLDFKEVVGIALDLREHVESYGYHPFVKTTGRKGLHVVMPLESRWSYDHVFEAAKSMVQPFVEKHNRTTTLHIAKEHRRGRVLVDIYRNRPSQTIVAAYSLRGLPGAPVSTPLTWDELREIRHSRDLNIGNVARRVLDVGDPWETLGAYAVALHTDRAPQPIPTKAHRRSRFHKTPEQLEKYSQKREFTRTPEPLAEIATGRGNTFVVHRHHATRLHYDLRLEQDGLLKSWAVPKGLPPRPGVKRLAVHVEDHPLEYATFEGMIPKGEYGGGKMWIYASGIYERTKEKKNGFYFRLNSRELSAEYRIHLMKENQWLLERVDNPQIDWLETNVEPMLAELTPEPPRSTDFLFEVKWDGIRAIITVDEGQLRIRTRNHMDVTAQFPELNLPDGAFRATNGVFDGEIVCLDPDGKPVFRDVIHRMQQRGDKTIATARSKHPAVCYLFDCLYLDGRLLIHDPLLRRREWLEDVVKPGTPYRISMTVEEGDELFAAARAMKLEGIIAKRKNSPYLPGKRSDHWRKIKTRSTIDCLVIGYTRGNGDRESTFGALHIAVRQEDRSLRYLGKVGTGFDDKTVKTILSTLRNVKKTDRPIPVKPPDDHQTTWIEAVVVCEVQYASITKDGMLREPVFLKLRPDL